MKQRFKLQRSDLEIIHLKGSGPGGQHRNKRMTGIRIIHLPTGIVAMATERRSQEQNLNTALFRLEEKVRRYFFTPKTRIPTKKSKSSGERRLQEKRRRAQTKQGRQSTIKGDGYSH